MILNFSLQTILSLSSSKQPILYLSGYQEFNVEEYGDIYDAIAREKQIKGWKRIKKIRLFEKENPK